MDELHQAARAYFNNGSEEQKALAWRFFQALDVDGDGHVSLEEYKEVFCQTVGLPSGFLEMYQELDRNRDDQLDFLEVLTLYYVARTRASCDSCGQVLLGLHFSCVTCFDKSCDQTFDLCTKCYTYRTYSHSHSLFLDSYVLLRAKRSPNPPAADDQNLPQQKPSEQPPNDQGLVEEEEGFGWRDAYHAMDAAVTAGIVVAACTIM